MNSARNNYAGALAPETSEYGNAFRRSLPSLYAHVTTLVDPKFYSEYRGLLGVVVTRAARVQHIATIGQYGGELPNKELPTIEAPNPWEIGI